MADAIRVSNSQLQKFDRCKFAWYLSYVRKIQPIRKAYPLTFGSTVHTLLDNYYQGVIDGVPDLLAHHQQFVQQLSGSLGDMDALQALSHAGSLVERYITDFAFFEDQMYNVVATERHYEVELETPQGRPYVFELYFDLLLQDKETAKLWMVDHKTHKSNPWSETQIMMDPQLPSYAIVLREKLGVDVFGLIYNLLNSYEYKKAPHPDKLFQRKKTYRTPVELDSILLEIGHAVDEMQDTIVYRKSLKRDCDRCDFQDPCLMSLKGMDIDDFLDGTFETKPERRRDEEKSEEPLRLI